MSTFCKIIGNDGKKAKFPYSIGRIDNSPASISKRAAAVNRWFQEVVNGKEWLRMLDGRNAVHFKRFLIQECIFHFPTFVDHVYGDDERADGFEEIDDSAMESELTELENDNQSLRDENQHLKMRVALLKEKLEEANDPMRSINAKLDSLLCAFQDSSTRDRSERPHENAPSSSRLDVSRPIDSDKTTLFSDDMSKYLQKLASRVAAVNDGNTFLCDELQDMLRLRHKEISGSWKFSASIFKAMVQRCDRCKANLRQGKSSLAVRRSELSREWGRAKRAFYAAVQNAEAKITRDGRSRERHSSKFATPPGRSSRDSKDESVVRSPERDLKITIPPLESP
eukprot:g2123.t1